jgi:hypothetical protein
MHMNALGDVPLFHSINFGDIVENRLEISATLLGILRLKYELSVP